MAQGEIKTALAQAAEPFVENLYHCLRCNYCVEMHWEERAIQHVCPTLVHHNPAPGYSGKGYLAAARAILEGEELPVNSLVERFFNCTTCGNCEEVCPVGLKPAHLVKRMRAAMVAQGLAPASLASIAANVVERHDPAGAPVEARNRFAEGLDGVLADAATLYLPGCAASYDTPAESRATVSVLRQCGVPVRLLSPAQARCCGAPLSEIGYAREAENERAGLCAAIAGSGCRSVATSGAECLESLVGAQLGGGCEVVHAFDLIERAAAGGRVAFEARTDIAAAGVIGLLDSCHLSKKSHGAGVAANYPRRIRELLSRLGCKTAAVADDANYAICCGAAGGMPSVSPQSAARMAEGKLQSFARSGAAVVLTASPLCAAHLRRSHTAGLPPVMGLFEFIDTYFRLRSVSP
jgi:heterodisulfide reductase subunit D